MLSLLCHEFAINFEYFHQIFQGILRNNLVLLKFDQGDFIRFCFDGC